MKKALKGVLLASAALPLAGFAVCEAIASRGNARGGADYLLILGHALQNNCASPILEKRCERAAEFLKEHPDTVAIACGGKTDKNQAVTEAEVIRKILTEKGIDPNRIILEDKSTTTAENFFNAKRLMSGEKKPTVILLSSDYHLLRAGALAKSCGIDAQTLAAPTPHSSRLFCFARELFAFPFMYINLKEAKKHG